MVVSVSMQRHWLKLGEHTFTLWKIGWTRFPYRVVIMIVVQAEEQNMSILSRYGKLVGLDSQKVPANGGVSEYAEALAKDRRAYFHAMIKMDGLDSQKVRANGAV